MVLLHFPHIHYYNQTATNWLPLIVYFITCVIMCILTACLKENKQIK